MISYEKMWRLAKERGITYYRLNTYFHIGTNTLYRLQHNQFVHGSTLNKLCYIFECQISDIAEFIPDEAERNDLLGKEDEYPL